jgi:ABC-2 type transport system ATP-binding protein
MIEVTGLTKFYGDKIGIKDVSFTISKGETVGLLGPNGAGKTTIMKMLAGHMLPTSGSISIDGIDVVDNPKKALRNIGFMPEIPPLYTEMDVVSYLNFIADIKGIKPKERTSHIAEIMDLTAITDVKGRLIKNLSKGYRQRVGLAHALVGFPSVLILDEPTVGLDPKQITEVRKLIENLSRDHTVILSSHILSEIKMICKRVIIISSGRIVLEEEVANLEEGGKNFIIRVRGKLDDAGAILKNIPGIEIQSSEEQTNNSQNYCRFMLFGESGVGLREEVFNALAKAKLPIVEMRTIGNSLEDIFLDITKQN